jgi:hypothetical protein
VKPVALTSDEERIAGNFFDAKRPGGLVFLLLHGWRGHQNMAAAKALADLGFPSLT